MAKWWNLKEKERFWMGEEVYGMDFDGMRGLLDLDGFG